MRQEMLSLLIRLLNQGGGHILQNNRLQEKALCSSHLNQGTAMQRIYRLQQDRFSWDPEKIGPQLISREIFAFNSQPVEHLTLFGGQPLEMLVQQIIDAPKDKSL